jgi:four helix bundle protein
VIERYRDLDVWQKAMDLAEEVYALSRSFPPDERFGLTSQIRRAAVSVPSCIAGGNVRSTTRDDMRFVAIATGSAAEMETQLRLAARLQMADPQAIDTTLEHVDHISRMLNRLRQSLQSRLDADT